MKKIIFVLLDGLADDAKPSPLQAAKKPNLDFLAKQGICGVLDNEITGKDFSEAANFNILGYPEHPGRGYVEAVGAGLKPGDNDICFRSNFATVNEDFVVLDRRAGREEKGLDELAEELNGMRIKNCEITFKHTLGHRAVLIISGEELCEHVSATDPKKVGERVREAIPTIPEHDKDFPKAKKTAKILNEFTKKSFHILSKHEINKKRKIPANIVLSRNPGKKMELESFEKKYGMKAACIAGVTGTIGVAKILGMRAIQKGNGLTTTDLGEKVQALFEFLKKYDFIWLHIKGTDVAAHDKKYEEKKEFIERIDREVFSELINLENVLIVVTTDHITSSITGEHMLGYVPILIYGNGKDDVSKFDEESVIKGDLGIIKAHELIKKLVSMREK